MAYEPYDPHDPLSGHYPSKSSPSFAISTSAGWWLFYLRASQLLVVVASLGLAVFYALGGYAPVDTFPGTIISTLIICILPGAALFILLELLCRRLMRSIRNAVE